jgi:uncharacterized protein involved in exopolysaccharide biosynthesis
MKGTEELKLNDYLRIIIENQRLIIWGTALCILVAGILSFILPRVYQSQLLLEVGKIYLPPARDKSTQDVELIEEPKAAAEVLRSEALLYQVREKLGLTILIEKMRQNLEVVTFPEERGSVKMGSPLIEIIYRGNPPPTAVQVLNLLAAEIVAEHSQTYEDNVNALRSRIRNLEGKIADLQKVIEQQQNYRRQSIEQAALISGKVREFEKKSQTLNVGELSNTEAIFLNSAASNQERILTSLNDAMAAAEVAIGENQEKIGDYRDEIANLTNLANLCRNTRVRSKPVIPEKPIRPNKSLNIIIGGLVGLTLTVGLAFFKEYGRP